jgi:hypothetical protein
MALREWMKRNWRMQTWCFHRNDDEMMMGGLRIFYHKRWLPEESSRINVSTPQ